MKLSFTPTRMNNQYEASVSGDALTIDGEVLDFGPLPDGATLPKDDVDCPWLASDVERIDGEICLTLMLPHGANAPEETRFPEMVTVAEGEVVLPPYDVEPEPKPEPEPELEEEPELEPELELEEEPTDE
jgi:hypothetical protein|tara:strand:+ start:61 stop:450 length:390 start_codon:yes stop_codon:yes gene_type:complete